MRQEELRPTLLPMNLQFFAEGGETATDEGADNTDEGTEGGDQSQSGKDENKTFTQAELNKMMKAEKESGKRAILKELGIDAKDSKSVKEEWAKYQEFLDSKKTTEEKTQQTLATLTSEKTQAEERANFLENKFVALGEGVRLDAVDDVVALATLKVTDDKDLKTVITEMKEKYPNFFTDGSGTGSPKGTGTGIGSGKGVASKPDGIGSRLAASKNPASQQQKSSYFSR